MRYQGDDRLGADRSVSCVAAMEKYGKPLVVLDFGTATTVDALSPDGEYLGGCILAGIRVSTDALFHQAAMLPRIELIRPASVLGKNTIAQIQLFRSWGISVPSSTLSARPRRRCPAVRTPPSLLPVAWLGSLQITLISSMWWMVSSFWMVFADHLRALSGRRN
ncbi:MAG: type III pantothenate kinase [Evtepia sp.]